MFLTYDTVEAFAVNRNPSISFPFLKENGELLSIAVNCGFLIEPRALGLYSDFYKKAYRLTTAFPQYYRFTLAMVLDLESAGMRGDEGQKIANYVIKNDLVNFDTSDVRRLETLSLLSKSTDWPKSYEALYHGILSRLADIFKNPTWYAKFNKPLSYDLTHILFFLSDYGRRELDIGYDPEPCLLNVGLLALLDNDADLLSEVCMCLKYLGCRVPEYWDSYLTKSRGEIAVTFDCNIASALNPTVDEYHLYLVSNAYLAIRENTGFADRFKSKTPNFSVSETAPSLLAKLSDFAFSPYMKSQCDRYSLNCFANTLAQGDDAHWQAALASHNSSLSVLNTFSGLAA